jgi:hypothetical protein
LVLSIWSADGKLQEEISWGRRLVVNDSLVDYFSGEAGQEASVLHAGREELARLRSRIRCFVWAPTLPVLQSAGIIGTQDDWGQYLIAIANDDNHVVLARINSPATTFGVDKDWSATALCHFSAAPDSGNIMMEAATSFDDLMQEQRYVSSLAWSPWVVRNDTTNHTQYYQSTLAFSTNKQLRTRIVTCTNGTISLGPETTLSHLDLRNNGTMKWSPVVLDSDKLILATFTHAGITCFTVSALDTSIISKKFTNPDGRADEKSGVVWDHLADSPAQLHFPSFTTTKEVTTAVMEVSGNSDMSPRPTPNWCAQINDSRILFSVEHELQGHAKSKTWGLCASPLRDFTAVCYTIHPSDMIEYGPPAVRRSTVAINGLRSFSQPTINFPNGHASAEAIMYTIRKWLDNTVEVNQQVAGFTKQVLEKMVEIYAPESHESPDAGWSELESGLNKLIREFKRKSYATLLSPSCTTHTSSLTTLSPGQALLNRKSVLDRYTILVSLACTPDTPRILERALIAYRLASTTILLPASHSRVNPFSAEILASHQQVVRLIHSLISSATPVENGSSNASASGVVAGSDTCDLCTAPIHFTDLSQATCTRGHVFPRCGISFLAIQAPRITKVCGICETSFLSEDFVEEQEKNGEKRGGDTGAGRAGEEMDVDGGEDGGDIVSLAKVLFQACDVCVYCGGKFIG